MISKQIGDVNLTVTMAEKLQKDLTLQGINPGEIYRLIFNFAEQLLVVKNDTELVLTNDETGAQIILAVQWESQEKVTMKVIDTVRVGGRPERQFDLAPKLEEAATCQ